MDKSLGASDRYGGVMDILPGFLRVFIPLISFFCFVFVINFTVDTTFEKKLLQIKREQQVQMSLQSLQRDVSGIIQSLKYLAGSDALQRFINGGTQRQRSRIEKDIANFARHMDRYDQVRWLDSKGIERLRIDHRSGNTRIVPITDLQDKSNRYYYKEAIVLPPGAVFVSPLDLNVEHGEVEKPHRPMLRFATPTVDVDGGTNGLLIFNYQASLMLENFAATRYADDIELVLLNAQGYWLYSSKGDPAWGFMFGRDERFGGIYPQAWQEIKNRSSGNMEIESGLYTFDSFDAEAFSKQKDISTTHANRQQELLAPLNRARWIVIARSPPSAMGFINLEHFKHYAFLLILSFIVLAMLSWRSARSSQEKSRLLDRLRLHATVMKNATNGIMITDRKNRIISINNAFTELTGYSEEEVIGKDPSILSSGRHGGRYFSDMWQNLEERGHWEGEMWNRHKNGELYPEWVTITSVLDHNGEHSNYIGIFSLLSEQKSTEARLRELANSDPLTGLINRNLFLDRAAQALITSRRYQSKTAILFLDLDGFKPVNDSYGHAVGDMVLREVARRMQESVRGSDTVARFGGDEFVILLTGIKDTDEVAVIANKLIESVSRQIQFGDDEYHVGASIGISICPDDADTVESLISFADEAMYKAKEEGRGKYCFSGSG